jgi:hypothetical protein
MTAADGLSDDQFFKVVTSVNRRINNLESRFGGTIGPEHAEMTGKWWQQKQKLLAERDTARLSRTLEPFTD